MDKLDEYSLPPAWRGVASPRHLRLARWLSLIEELGGVRGLSPTEQGALGSVLIGSACEAGKVDMSLMTISCETEQLDDLRRFVAENLARHERLVLLLFYAEGLSLMQIAEVLDLPEATVADVFRRTLATLREHFG
jgi:hypothetical protein